MISSALLLLLFASPSWASTVHIFVTDGTTKDCPPPKTVEEETRYILKPKEAAASLKRYVESKKNPELYDAAFVNAGLKFCQPSSAKVVFKELVNSLKPDEPTKRTWEVVSNYKADVSLLDEVEDRLKNKKLPENFRDNLLKARGMLYPRGFDPRKVNRFHGNMPEPSPSPK